MALDFSKTQSKAMVDRVMAKIDDTELDNKKREISLDQIDLNPDNEDIFGYEDVEHLSKRIAENGFYGAIEVYAKKDGRYEISSGHRRYLACKMLGWEKIPCIVSADVNDVDKAKHLIEGNIHNRVMTPYKMAKAIEYYDKNVVSKTKKELRGTGFDKQKIIAEVFNISRSAVGRYLAILKLIPEFQELTKDANFPYTNLLGLITLSKEDQYSIYYDLLKYAGDDGIGSLSKGLIEQITYKHTNKKEEDGRNNKELGRGTPQRQIIDEYQDDEDITYHNEQTEPVINYGLDDSEEPESDNTSFVVPQEKADPNARFRESFSRFNYLVKVVEDLDINHEWPEEYKSSAKEKLEGLQEKISKLISNL